MSLDPAAVIDRRRLKRRLIFWRIFGVIAAVAAVIAGMGRFGETGFGDHVARLSVDGLIVNDRIRENALAAVAANDSVKALIVGIDSPGGTYVGGESLYQALRIVAAKKPVVALMNGTATSAAYMIALGADRIFARSGTVTGSIGVIMQTADVTGLLAKLGIKPETIKSGPLKAQPNPMEPFTPAARAAIQNVIEDLYGLFVDLVAERRGMDRTEVTAMADGRIYSGRQAKAKNLIDAIGTESTALAWLVKDRGVEVGLPVHEMELDYGDEPWRELLGSRLSLAAQTIFGKALFSERLRLDGVISLWHPEAQ